MAEKTIPWWRRALEFALDGLRTGFGLFARPAKPSPASPEPPQAGLNPRTQPDLDTVELTEPLPNLEAVAADAAPEAAEPVAPVAAAPVQAQPAAPAQVEVELPAPQPAPQAEAPLAPAPTPAEQEVPAPIETAPIEIEPIQEEAAPTLPETITPPAPAAEIVDEPPVPPAHPPDHLPDPAPEPGPAEAEPSLQPESAPEPTHDLAVEAEEPEPEPADEMPADAPDAAPAPDAIEEQHAIEPEPAAVAAGGSSPAANTEEQPKPAPEPADELLAPPVAEPELQAALESEAQPEPVADCAPDPAAAIEEAIKANPEPVQETAPDTVEAVATQTEVVVPGDSYEAARLKAEEEPASLPEPEPLPDTVALSALEAVREPAAECVPEEPEPAPSNNHEDPDPAPQPAAEPMEEEPVVEEEPIASEPGPALEEPAPAEPVPSENEPPTVPEPDEPEAQLPASEALAEESAPAPSQPAALPDGPQDDLPVSEELPLPAAESAIPESSSPEPEPPAEPMPADAAEPAAVEPEAQAAPAESEPIAEPQLTDPEPAQAEPVADDPTPIMAPVVLHAGEAPFSARLAAEPPAAQAVESPAPESPQPPAPPAEPPAAQPEIDEKAAAKLAARQKKLDESAEQSPFSVMVGQVYEGPLDLLLDLIRKQDIDIYDIPIATITAQFLSYVNQLRAGDVDVAGEFIYTASLLIHIKSKMLLPRTVMGPEDAAEDPRRELVERLLEHERFKNAAQMLAQKQMLEAATWTNPGSREFKDDEGTEPEIAADTVDLVRIFRDILERARKRPAFNVEEDSVTVGQMVQFLARRLTMEDKPVALRRLLSHTHSERALIAMFLALLELVRLQAVLLRQDRAFSEIFVKKHSSFEAVMNEGTINAQDDWR